MNALHLVGASTTLAVACWLVSIDRTASKPAQGAPLAATPIAEGHDVLVVQGDRDGLSITTVSHKPDPFGGVAKGLDSAWRLRVLDADAAVLVDLPLDMTHFAIGEADRGRGLRVDGCTVRDERIGMLVSAPTFATAARYVFVRPGPTGEPVVIGDVPAITVRQLAEGRR